MAPPPFFLAYVSTLREQEHCDPATEISPALALLGPILERYGFPLLTIMNFSFVFISDYYVPAMGHSGPKNIFISCSYDSSSHFESVCTDVKELYHKITGGHIEEILQKGGDDQTTHPSK